jgi:hypothetical protein
MTDRREEEQHHRMLGLEQHADVVILLQAAKTDIEKHMDLKLSALRAWGVAALLGGQALAGLLAALVTRTTPADAGRTALAFINHLF